MIPKIAEMTVRSNQKGEPVGNCLNDDLTDQAYDMVTGDNDAPNLGPEFLTGRVSTRTYLNQPHDNLNP